MQKLTPAMQDAMEAKQTQKVMEVTLIQDLAKTNEKLATFHIQEKDSEIDRLKINLEEVSQTRVQLLAWTRVHSSATDMRFEDPELLRCLSL
jgi:wyosine [tRNA(Phe)-imidazoG37] synthetase (radical SAM superfamily)